MTATTPVTKEVDIPIIEPVPEPELPWTIPTREPEKVVIRR